MDRIDAATLTQLPLDAIEKVTFFKRDEITTDLICCEVEIDGKTWFFHEEAAGWDLLIRHLEGFAGVSRRLVRGSRAATVRGVRDGGVSGGDEDAVGALTEGVG